MLAETLKKVITDEINLRVGDAHTVEQNINTVRRNLNRLRQAVCADFYDDNFKTQLQKPYHRTVKSTFAGKRPASREIVESEDDTPNSSNENHRIVWHEGEVTDEMVKSERLADRIDDCHELQQMRYLDVDEKSQLADMKNKRPRYVPPVMPAEKIQRSIEPRGDKASMKIRILVRNTSKYIYNRKHTSGETHRWTVFVTLNDSSLSIGKIVSKAVFYLHPTYEPNHIITVKSAPFKITRRGWGEFDIRVKLFFFNEKDEPADIIHSIRLDAKHSGMETFGGETICDHYISDLPSTDPLVESAERTSEANNPEFPEPDRTTCDAKYTTGKSPVKRMLTENFYNDDLLNYNNLSIPDLFNFDDGDLKPVVKIESDCNEIDLKRDKDDMNPEIPCSVEINSIKEEKEDLELGPLQNSCDATDLKRVLNDVSEEIVAKSKENEFDYVEEVVGQNFGLADDELYMSDLLECHNEVVISETPENTSAPETSEVSSPRSEISTNDITENYRYQEVNSGATSSATSVVDYDNVEIDDLIKFPNNNTDQQKSTSAAQTVTYTVVSSNQSLPAKPVLTSAVKAQNSVRQTLLISAEDWAAILKKNSTPGQPLTLQKAFIKGSVVKKVSPKKVVPTVKTAANKRVSKLSTLLSGPSLTAPRILPSTSFSIPVSSTVMNVKAVGQPVTTVPNRTFKIVTTQSPPKLQPKTTGKLVSVRPSGTHLLVKMPDGTVKPVEALKPLKPYVLKTANKPTVQPIKVQSGELNQSAQTALASNVKLQTVVPTGRQLVRKRLQPAIIRGSIAKKHCPDAAVKIADEGGSIAGRPLPVLLPRLPTGRVIGAQQRLVVSPTAAQIRLSAPSTARQQPTYVILSDNEPRQLTMMSRVAPAQPLTMPAQGLSSNVLSLKATPKRKLQEVESELEVKNPYALECERKIADCPKDVTSDGNQAMSWFLSCFPLVDKRANDPKFRDVFPYCAASVEIFKSWPLGKQLSREFHRANDVLKELKKLRSGMKINKKDVINFARRRAYTIYDLKKIDPNSVSYTFCSVKSLTVGEEMQFPEDDDDDLEIDVDTPVSSRPASPSTSVSPEATNRLGKVFMTLAPYVDEARTIEHTLEGASVRLEPEEILDDVYFPAALRTLMSAFRSFADDLIRRSYEVAYVRYKETAPSEILPGDIIQALFSCPEFDLFTDQGLGRLPKSC